MHDAQLVSRSQGQSRLAGDIERARNGEVAFFLQYRTQRLAAHVFHGDKRTAVFGDVEIIEPHGVRVVQLAGDDRLALEAIKKDRKSTRLNSSHQIISYAVF